MEYVPLTVIVFLALLFIVAPVRAERSADEWFLLTIDLERRIDDKALDNDDRVFIRRMINLLTVDQAATPDRAQAKWLLSIRRRLDNGSTK